MIDPCTYAVYASVHPLHSSSTSSSTSSHSPPASPLTRLTLGAALALHTPSARNPKAMLRAPEIRDALVYRSFRGGSNAPSSVAGAGLRGGRGDSSGASWAGRMRSSNYRGCESAARLSRRFFLFFPPRFARRRVGSTRGADSRLFAINRGTRRGGSGRRESRKSR